MKKIKLFPKIFILTFSILSILTLFIHLIVYTVFPKIYIKDIKDNVTIKADDLSKSLNNKDNELIKDTLEIYSQNSKVKAYIQDVETFDFSVPGDVVLDPESNSHSVVIEKRSIVAKDGKEYDIQFISATDIKKDARDLSLQFLPYSIFFSFFFSIITAYIYSKMIVSPILDIKDVTNRMMNIDRQAELKVNSNDEIGDLKNQINILYQRLLGVIDDLDEKNKAMLELEKKKVEFLRATSHELKTPLSSLNVILENMRYNIGKYKDRDKYLDESLQIVDNLSKMIIEIISLSSLHELEEIDSHSPIKTSVEEVVSEYEILQKEKAINLQVNISNQISTMSPFALKKVLTNLYGNAIKYTFENGLIKIYNENIENREYLVVENTGPTMTKEEIEDSFNLFYSNDNDKGNGLGLFIIKNILEKYDKDYKFISTDDGMKFQFEI